MPRPSAKAADAGETREMSAYEKARLEKIKKREAMMEELKLKDMANSLMPAKPKPARATGPRKRRSKLKRDPSLYPPRRSGRLQGEAAARPEGLLDQGGVLVKIAGETIRYRANAEGLPGVAMDRGEHSQKQREAKLGGPVAMTSANASNRGDRAFKELLKTEGSCAEMRQLKGRGRKGKDIASWTLESDDWVVKVVPSAAVHMAFAPRSDAVVLAAGGKEGSVGLWCLNHDTWEPSDAAGFTAALEGVEAEEGDGAATAKDVLGKSDGVSLYSVHAAYISGFVWTADGLTSSSYDGTVRRMDPAAERFELLFRDEDRQFSAFDMTPGLSLLADKDGELSVFDPRAPKGGTKFFEAHDRKINTVHVEPVEQRLVATSGTDNAVSVWDSRKLGSKAKPLHSYDLDKSSQGAFWSPDGSQKLLLTCYDNHLRVVDVKTGGKDGGWSKCTRVKHNTQTGRWVTPFRAVWSPEGDSIVCGSMNREICIYDAAKSSGGCLARLSNAELQTAISSRHVFHPELPFLAAATASGRAHIYTP
ncbi:unnamed protein product [Pedinophyceae sp. YPF-701]|nr:unnamed protein product [Pedinophyceae sp. YPF-701]